MPKELLESVKNYFDITWEDPSGDKKLEGMILRSMAWINKKCGKEFDYLEEETAKQLLLNRIIYERSGVLEEFPKAYQDEIIALQLETRSERNAEA